MAAWYCYVDGQQYGPVPFETLKEWVSQGRVKATDYIWQEGTPSWVVASSVPGLAISPTAAIGTGTLVPVASPGGTGGRMSNTDITAAALKALRSRWGLPIGFCVLFTIISVAVGCVPIPYAGALVSLILTGPLELGAVVFFLSFTRGGQAEVGMLFSGFRRFGVALGAYLLRALFVFLWMLPGMLPGMLLPLLGSVILGAPYSDRRIETLQIIGFIVAATGMVLTLRAQLAYSQTMYLLAEDRTLGPLAAIRRSKQMMNGHKVRLFFLQLRFAGWAILCIFTLGIGLLWLWPYMYASFAKFYDDLRPPLPVAAAVPALPPVSAEPKSPDPASPA
ncbi:MAG: DUF975 family protein [Phycisphaerae bacterium]|jgi:uncharacterized membrane protein